MIKAVVIVCAQVLLIQSTVAHCIGAPLATPCGALGYPSATGSMGAASAPAGALAASNGPGVAVSTASPLSPVGVSVRSEVAYEGTVVASGVLPFLGTVAVEGVLPTAGTGAVAYGCGNGAVGITAEDVGAYGYAGLAGPLGYGAAGRAGPLGYGPGYAGIGGCGCGI